MPKVHDVLTRRLAGLCKHRGMHTSDPWKQFARQLVREYSIDGDLAEIYASKPREAVRRMLERLATSQLAPRKTVEAWLDALGDDPEPMERWGQRDANDRNARIEQVVNAAALRDRDARKGETGEFKSTMNERSRPKSSDIDDAVDATLRAIGKGGPADRVEHAHPEVSAQKERSERVVDALTNEPAKG